MGHLRDFLTEFGPGTIDNIKIVVAGALGGFVRWRALKEGWVAGSTSMVIGAISAIYLGPLVSPIIELFLNNVIVDPVSQKTFAGFIVGLTGTALVGFVMDLVRKAGRRLSNGNGVNPGNGGSKDGDGPTK